MATDICCGLAPYATNNARYPRTAAASKVKVEQSPARNLDLSHLQFVSNKDLPAPARGCLVYVARAPAINVGQCYFLSNSDYGADIAGGLNRVNCGHPTKSAETSDFASGTDVR
jgi:hypothetical protein